MNFKIVMGETALGIEHKFVGPGLSQYANGVHFLQVPNAWALKCMEGDEVLSCEEKIDHSFGKRQAETVIQLLEQAFEAGKTEAKRELRAMLGIHQ